MKILFVCLGNICRSPLADGVMRRLVQENKLDWEIDSAGTGGWHAGEAPDKRAQAIAKKFGTDIGFLRARQFQQKDFEEFDKIYVMDAQNYKDVLAQTQNPEHQSKVDLFLNLSHPGENRQVPDPWYDDKLFEPVYKMVEEACRKLLP